MRYGYCTGFSTTPLFQLGTELLTLIRSTGFDYVEYPMMNFLNLSDGDFDKLIDNLYTKGNSKAEILFEPYFNNYLGNPLVHFYCDYDKCELSFGKEETIYFRDYYDYIYELREQRKKLGVAGTVQLDKKLFEDFY